MFSLVWLLFCRLSLAQTESPTPEPSPTIIIDASPSPTLTLTPTPTLTPTSVSKPFANIQFLPTSSIKNETFIANISLENLSIGKTYYIKFFSVSNTPAFDTLNGSTWLSGTSSWSSFPYVVANSQSQTTTVQARSSQSGAFNDLKIRLHEGSTNYDSSTQSSIVIYEPTPTPTLQPTEAPTSTTAPTSTPTPIPTSTPIPTQAPSPTTIPTPAPTAHLSSENPIITPSITPDPTPTDLPSTETPTEPNLSTIAPEVIPTSYLSSTSGEVLGSTDTTFNIVPVLLIAGGGLVFLIPLFISFFKK